jgi:hypothetical protein
MEEKAGNGSAITGVTWKPAKLLPALLLAGAQLAAQAVYQPKFPGDPARSESEAAALGYMRTVLRAQRQYKRKYDHYATSLAALVHTGSFTRRMVNPDRGDYRVNFLTHKDGFQLTLTPRGLDAQHRSFYAGEDGVIHASEDKPADANSPVVK